LKIQRLLTIQAGNATRILTFAETCEVGSFDWDNGTELFKPTTSLPHLGDVSEWMSASEGGVGIFVFRSGKSSCSSSQGVFVITMDSNGSFSSKQTLLSGSFSRMSITQYAVGSGTALFVLGEDEKTIRIFHWSVGGKRFELKEETKMEVRVRRMRATPTMGSIGLFFESEFAVHFHRLNSDGTLVELGKEKFVSPSLTQSSDALIQVVNTGGKTFGLVESRYSAIKPDCTLQVRHFHLRIIYYNSKLTIISS